MGQTDIYNRHLPELDGVRGMAILLIFFNHCFPLLDTPLPNSLAQMLKDSMWIGVDLFFVLSGFLITRILIGLKGKNKKYVIFYGRRSLRIFPLYYFSLIMVFFVLSRNPIIKETLEYVAPKQWFFLYSYNIYVLINNSVGVHYLLTHFWSLCVEEQFYLIWPFVLFNFPLKKLPHVMIGTICISILAKIVFFLNGMAWSVLYTSTITRMDCFALGGLVAYEYLLGPKEKIQRPAKIIFFISLVILIGYFIVAGGIKATLLLTQIVITPFLALFFSTLIHIAIKDRSRFIKGFFLQKWLRFLGKYSYGIYVYHFLLYVVIIRLDIFQLNLKDSWLGFFLIVLTTLVGSVLSYHIFELPFLKAKKYFEGSEDRGVFMEVTENKVIAS